MRVCHNRLLGFLIGLAAEKLKLTRLYHKVNSMKLFAKNQRVSNSPSKIRGGARRAGALMILWQCMP